MRSSLRPPRRQAGGEGVLDARQEERVAGAHGLDGALEVEIAVAIPPDAPGMPRGYIVEAGKP